MMIKNETLRRNSLDSEAIIEGVKIRMGEWRIVVNALKETLKILA